MKLLDAPMHMIQGHSPASMSGLLGTPPPPHRCLQGNSGSWNSRSNLSSSSFGTYFEQLPCQGAASPGCRASNGACVWSTYHGMSTPICSGPFNLLSREGLSSPPWALLLSPPLSWFSPFPSRSWLPWESVSHGLGGWTSFIICNIQGMKYESLLPKRPPMTGFYFYLFFILPSTLLFPEKMFLNKTVFSFLNTPGNLKRSLAHRIPENNPNHNIQPGEWAWIFPFDQYTYRYCSWVWIPLSLPAFLFEQGRVVLFLFCFCYVFVLICSLFSFLR